MSRHSAIRRGGDGRHGREPWPADPAAYSPQEEANLMARTGIALPLVLASVVLLFS